MARDRQSAKRRQAERREERLRAQAERSRQRSHGGDGDGTAGDRGPERPGRPVSDDDASRLSERELDRAREGGGADDELDPATRAQLASGAPPEDTGRSDTVVESPPPAPDVGAEDAEEPEDGSRGREPEAAQRGRVTAFLVAVWAELQRVQWPDRKTLTTLTGVVLGFVLIAGGYLGLLDGLLQAFFSRLLGSGP